MFSVYTNSTNQVGKTAVSANTQISQQKSTKKIPIFNFKTSQEKFQDFMPKFYTVDFDSIDGIKYITDYSDKPISIDRKIDATTQVKNDCWLLTGINALSSTTVGKEYIKKAIIHHKSNNITIHFRGTNTTINIPQIVFEGAKQSNYYVKGDDDMLAIEIATEYYKKMLITNNEAAKNPGPNVITGKHSSGNLKDPLAGGFSSDIMFLITGKRSQTIFNDKNGCSKQIKETIDKKFKTPDQYAMTCNFKEAKNGLYIHHAYTIKSVDKDFITLINPHNSAKEEKIPINEFYENVASVTLLDLNKC